MINSYKVKHRVVKYAIFFLLANAQKCGCATMADWVTNDTLYEAKDIQAVAEALAVCTERISKDLNNSLMNSRNDVWIIRNMLAHANQGKRPDRTSRNGLHRKRPRTSDSHWDG